LLNVSLKTVSQSFSSSSDVSEISTSAAAVIYTSATEARFIFVFQTFFFFVSSVLLLMFFRDFIVSNSKSICFFYSCQPNSICSFNSIIVTCVRWCLVFRCRVKLVVS
jgi:hypothetical protein